MRDFLPMRRQWHVLIAPATPNLTALTATLDNERTTVRAVA
jgi:hypothetical protein